MKEPEDLGMLERALAKAEEQLREAARKVDELQELRVRYQAIDRLHRIREVCDLSLRDAPELEYPDTRATVDEYWRSVVLAVRKLAEWP